MIMAAGCNPWPVPMAECQEKKKGFFRSRVIIATSNMSTFSPTRIKSIQHAEALARRWDLHVTMFKRDDGTCYFKINRDNAVLEEEMSMEQIINIGRGIYARKKMEYQARLEASRNTHQTVPHVCVAEFLATVAVPAHLAGTAMQNARPSHDATAPNHKYCHESLPCRSERQEHQGLWDWWKGTTTREDGIVCYKRELTASAYLWDPRIIDGIHRQEDAIRGFHNDIRAAIETYGLHNPLYINEDLVPFVRFSEQLVLEEFIDMAYFHGEGVRPLIDQAWFTRLFDYIPELRDLKLNVNVHPEDVDEFDRITAASRYDAVEAGFASPPERTLCYTQRLWSMLSDTLDRIKGFFSNLWTKVKDIVRANPWIIDVVVRLVLAIIISAVMWCMNAGPFADFDLKADPSEMINDEWKKKYVDLANKSGNKMNFESFSEKGGQRSMKGRTTRMNFESRDEKGGQKSNKMVRMQFESGLTIQTMRIGKMSFDFLRIHPEITKAVQNGEPWAKQALKDAHLEYCEVITRVLEENPTMTELNPKMNECVKEMYRTLVKEQELTEQTVVETLCPNLEEVGQAFSAFERSKKVKTAMFEAILSDYKIPSEVQQFQGSADQNADGIAKKISYNLCDISPDGGFAISKIFFYSGRKGWVNKHAWAILKTSMFVSLQRVLRNGTTIKTAFCVKDLVVVEHPSVDICLIQFPQTLSPFAHVLDFIARDSDMAFQTLPGGRIVTRRSGQDLWIQAARPRRLSSAYDTPTGPQSAFTGIEYDHMHTEFGDCGSPFMALDPTKQRKIMGFHMMGNTVGTGTSVIVTQEILQDMESNSKFIPELVVQAQEFQSNPDPMVHNPLGTMECKFAPTNTKVRRSVIHGMVSEPITRPAILRPTNGVNPMERGLNEMQRFKPAIPMDFVNEVQGALTRYISGEAVNARTLSYEEAISGRGIEGLEPVDRSKSAGLPLCNEPGVKGKTKWITEEHLPTPELTQMLDDFVAEVKSGVLTHPPCFKDTLKDERVKLAKADPNVPEKIKTRLFAASPMVLLIILRVYFGAFFAHSVINRTRNTLTSGTVCQGADWEQMAMWLASVSTKVDDGDYSCFDSTQPSGFLLATFNAIRTWYNLNGGTKEDDIIRMKLADLVIHPFHCANGTIFRVEGGNPSGVFGTTGINGGVNMVAFYYAFKQIYPMSNCTEFLDKIRTLTHGDDVLFSVHEDFDNFTSENIGKALAKIGMVFTPALKGDTATVARPIEEVTFLKRRFEKCWGIFRAPLATESSLEMCNWITKSNDAVTATIDNVRMAMRELAISEPDTTLQEALQAAVYEKTGTLLPIITKAELLKEFTSHF
jgi:hypothetical protein